MAVAVKDRPAVWSTDPVMASLAEQVTLNIDYSSNGWHGIVLLIENIALYKPSKLMTKIPHGQSLLIIII